MDWTKLHKPEAMKKPLPTQIPAQVAVATDQVPQTAIENSRPTHAEDSLFEQQLMRESLLINNISCILLQGLKH